MAVAVSSSWSGSSSLMTPHTITVGGLPVHVYGLPALTVPATSSAGLAVVFVLHGRTESHEHPSIMGIVNRVVESARERRLAPDGKGAKDLLVVTFDQRNHGHRTVDRDRNLGWMEGGRKRAQVRKDKGMQAHELDNVSHATDMLACQGASNVFWCFRVLLEGRVSSQSRDRKLTLAPFFLQSAPPATSPS